MRAEDKPYLVRAPDFDWWVRPGKPLLFFVPSQSVLMLFVASDIYRPVHGCNPPRDALKTAEGTNALPRGGGVPNLHEFILASRNQKFFSELQRRHISTVAHE